MSARIVSLVQIAAIIACPMWCSSGLCHAGRCDSMTESVAAAEVCAESATCCEKASRENGVPCRCPNEPCQGVCGGAVFEKPIEDEDYSAAFFLPLVCTDILLAPQIADRGTLNAEHASHFHDDGHGRSLRTLYMSFLC